MKATVGRWIVFAFGLMSVLWIAAAALRYSQAECDTRTVADYVPWEE